MKSKTRKPPRPQSKAGSNSKTKKAPPAGLGVRPLPQVALRRAAPRRPAPVVRRVGLKGGDFKPLPRPTPPPPPPPRASIALGKPRVPRGKPLPREFLFDIAKAIQAAVEPLIRSAKGREVVGTATSGDATFQLDKIAEKALLTFLRDARKPVAYYSEDSGYTTFTSGQPQHLLVVDPIDGTRAAKSGFEGCVVSIASTRVIERPRMVDVDNACVAEILTPRMFYAERGKGTRIYQDGSVKKPRLSKNANLETVVWAMTVPARPAELTFPTAAKLIDLTSLKGGFFACNSTSYSLTRLVTCQYDACVDFANRFLRDIPQMVEDQFINAGRGVVLGIAPYDLAASLLVAREAGCSVTDAYGHSFDEVLLLDSSVGNHRSMIAAANKELHEKLMSFFDTRIRQFEQLLQRRVRTE